MKIFQIARLKFAILGIDSKQVPSRQNTRLQLGFMISGLNITLCFMYVFYVANTFEEYVECINSTMGSVCSSMWFGLTVFQRPKLFEFIANAEKMIEISE